MRRKRINGVVGKTGKKLPKTPRPTDINPKAINNGFISLGCALRLSGAN